MKSRTKTNKRLTREEAVHRIADVFRRVGYEGASLSELSRATGLGKASLYHHFPGGKLEMAHAVFEWVGQRVAADVVGPLIEEGSPVERLLRWSGGITRLYEGGQKGCLLAAMVLGGSDRLFARELAQAFRVQIEGLDSVLRAAAIPPREARRRAEDAVMRIQGALIVSRGLGDPSHFRRVVAALPNELLS